MASSNFFAENKRLPCSFSSTSLKLAVEYMCLLIFHFICFSFEFPSFNVAIAAKSCNMDFFPQLSNSIFDEQCSLINARFRSQSIQMNITYSAICIDGSSRLFPLLMLCVVFLSLEAHWLLWNLLMFGHKKSDYNRHVRIYSCTDWLAECDGMSLREVDAIAIRDVCDDFSRNSDPTWNWSALIWK